MLCPVCSTENPSDNRFCGSCGTALALSCANCGADVPPGQPFCGQCGTRVDAAGSTAPDSPPMAESVALPPDAVGEAAERRVVSVLFVDLVGFTTLSEGRDHEAVREMLTDYFEQARRIVDRYGGLIEKFIGDAVMAVWGTPLARENDAERAVRAGLDLVDAVAALGERTGAVLQARAGVVTGEAAVWLDAVAQGMVAGDVVNTAARIQGQAEPGTVYVDEQTRDASSRSIGYRPAGSHALKGKAETIILYRADFVSAGDGGAMRFDGLEAPLIGRERDLRLVKEMFHDSAEESRARLVVVSGVAGVGKSRLGWEFFKYIDGLALDVFWHVGRCLSYGEGVAYWALADMIRMRLRISEGDPDEIVAERLDDGLAQYVENAEERAWLRPRLAVLLGIESGQAGAEVEQESLFAGWRLFIERLAQQDPVVLLFEDVQFADAGLLDFVEHVLERSPNLPIFMVALTRPELWDQRPDWAGRARGVTSLTLERLSDAAIESMVDALVDGLPASARTALATRAEGVPLFAIETVRMLIDRDVVIPQGGVYVLAADVGDLTDLDVPPTLHALVAARLDNLPEAQRRLVKDASVLGLSFTRQALEGLEAAVAGVPVGDIEALLGDLIRREVLSIHTDPRSPEAGQYRFLQKVMRTVAYDTLSRRDRKARHLAAAAHWEATADADDLAGVIATHYLEAADAVPDDPDVDELRSTSVGHLERAGDRARGLAASDEAMRWYERALELATAEDDQARLAERAGAVAFRGAGDDQRALSLLAVARQLNQAAGRLNDLARVAAIEGDALTSQGRHSEAQELLTDVYERTKDAPIDVSQAMLAATLSSAYYYAGDTAKAFEWIERACVVAEATGGGDPLLRAMNARGLLLVAAGRPVEGSALLRAALDIAVANGLDHRAALQAGNLALLSLVRDLAAADDFARRSVEHAARSGESPDRGFALQVKALVDLQRGTWSHVDLDGLRAEIESSGSLFTRVACAVPFVAISCWRGQVNEVVALVSELAGDWETDVQLRAEAAFMRTLVAPPASEQALADAILAFRLSLDLGMETDEFPLMFPVAVHLAVAAGDLDLARECVVAVRDRPASLLPELLRAQAAWLDDLVQASASPDGRQDMFESGIEQLRDFGTPFWHAWALTDQAEWLGRTGRADRAADAARAAMQIFAELEATPFLERAAALAGEELPRPSGAVLADQAS